MIVKNRATRPSAIDRFCRLVTAPMAVTLLLLGGPSAADDIRTERVQFAKGANSAVVEGRITGYETVDYVLGAGKGQLMNVSMATDNGANYFNILAPGETEVAFFNGSIDANQYEGTLPASGDYKIRVYLMRSAARRNEKASYRLEVIVTGSAARPASPAGGPATAPASERAGAGKFDATGKIPCSRVKGQPTTPCDFGVAREAGGTATVVVTRPDGGKRVIFFVKGKATGADTSEADGGAFSATRESDLNLVRIGEERYEIPDAVVAGG